MAQPQLERWKDAAGYEGLYQISDLGRLKALPARIWFGNRWYQKSVRILKCSTCNKFGHLFSKLIKNGERKSFLIHRLVLENFVGPCPEGLETRHHNGDAQDNRLENLCWGTPLENACDRKVHGTNNEGERNGRAKLTNESVAQMKKEYAAGQFSQARLARRYDIHPSVVSTIVHGKRWSSVLCAN